MENVIPHDNNTDALGFTEIEPNEKFGSGKLYRFGVVEIEIYEHPPDNKPPLARIRAPGLFIEYFACIRS